MHQGWMLRLSCTLAYALFVGGTTVAAPLPDFPPESIALEKTALEISYNPEHKQANWVFYPLGPKELRNCYNRNANFRADPELEDADAAQLSDYKDSGYDRGHLSPAGDNKWSKDAMTDSFLLSNVSPQPPAFNQHVWNKLEGLVRAWASAAQGLWVTTGPLLTRRLPTIGENEISVPEYFFKVLATKSGKRKNAIAYLVPVDANGDDFSRYAMTVDELERITGLDFLQGIDDEKSLEARLDLSNWDEDAKFKYTPCNGAPDFSGFEFLLQPR